MRTSKVGHNQFSILSERQWIPRFRREKQPSKVILLIECQLNVKRLRGSVPLEAATLLESLEAVCLFASG